MVVTTRRNMAAGTTCTSSRRTKPHSREVRKSIIFCESCERFCRLATIEYVETTMPASPMNWVGARSQHQQREREQRPANLFLLVGGEDRDGRVLDRAPLEELLLPLHDAHAARAKHDARLADGAGGRDADERLASAAGEHDDAGSGSSIDVRDQHVRSANGAQAAHPLPNILPSDFSW